MTLTNFHRFITTYNMSVNAVSHSGLSDAGLLSNDFETEPSRLSKD